MPITHTSSLNGSELSVEYSIANLAPTSMTMSYFTEKGLIGGGGGGTPVGGDVVEVEVPVNITGKIVNVEDTQSISYWVFIVDSQTERTFTISSMQGVLQNVNISITGDIAPYVTHCFRQNKKTSECSKTVNLKDGEEGYVTLIFSANRNMTGTLEGTVRIEGMASVLELPISADIFFQTPFLVENLEKYAGVEEDPSNWLTMIYLLELGAALAIVGVLLS